MRYPVAPGTLYGTAFPGACNEAVFNDDMLNGGLGMEGAQRALPTPPPPLCLPFPRHSTWATDRATG
jgi:hypothetical protein